MNYNDYERDIVVTCFKSLQVNTFSNIIVLLIIKINFYQNCHDKFAFFPPDLIFSIGHGILPDEPIAMKLSGLINKTFLFPLPKFH